MCICDQDLKHVYKEVYILANSLNKDNFKRFIPNVQKNLGNFPPKKYTVFLHLKFMARWL